ncbi:MAG: histone deacetylase family protein [Rhizobiaceae bacterium]|nr:histone deacetylase family protein [Rhizobiaceae bacterium]
MLTIYSEDHRKRDAKTELLGGQLIPPFEKPSRMDFILDRIHSEGLGEVIAPREFGMETILKIHDHHYVKFLQTVWAEWAEAGMKGEAIAASWPARRMQQRCPTDIDGKLGYYALAAETSITEGTWDAAKASTNVALEAASRLTQESAVFALCRPPGHHAALDMYGGYCFLNNAALAAQSLLDQGAERVAILDVDFHHGNGTQDIFYTRDDVLFISIHGQPEDAFPHFLGYEDETGQAAGEGYNRNFALPPGTPFGPWRDALKKSLDIIGKYGPNALVISLGTDTFEKDPISFFKLTSDDFSIYGSDLAQANLPTLFVMEGGYAVEEIGINTVNVLQGFEHA